MEPDLSASITKHPHPFRLEHSPPSRSSSRPPAGPSASAERSVSNFNQNASSTGVEVKSGENEDAGATIERHLSTHPTSPGGQSGISSTTAAGLTDVEGQTAAGPGGAGRLPRPMAENDPYGLSSAYKTDQELAKIKSTTSTTRRRAAGGGGGGSSAASDGSGDDNDDGNGNRNGRRINVDSVGSVSGADDNTANGGQGLFARCMPASFRSILALLVPSAARRALQTRKLKGFYKEQNALIENMLKSVEEHQAEARQEQGDDQLRYRIAVYGSFVANLVLAGLQVYGAVSSGSLSLFTTMADAIFDPLSNVTLIITNRAVKRVDPARFPSGKARLETVGNIAFCFIMTAVSFILIAFSVRQLIDGRDEGDEDTNKFHLPSILAVAIAFLTKFVLFLYTWAIKDRYSQVYILWQDHRNDLLINGFGLLTSVGGSKLVWWIDPAGAIVLGVLVSAIWLRTAFTEFLLLVGVTASAETQRLITYVCVTHSPAVQQIDTVRVYHSGPRLIAEVDVVMARDATLAETHDVAEALQFKLECLPDIERAYVHVDYETTHKPEHAFKKDI
ncbi:cation diffusion facilitator 1 [Ophiostoma piceae UAMH 11346]|uniref:Cation diffusion facilitator 1 n=1 Tax=Ophiostoma piceae (strain UAMH 11346) TaxID=1262450 RepID=S3CA86_OPHP1|nr:cation diffusion facilitator 1 [Ophiostoma piceae UAMH 11346]